MSSVFTLKWNSRQSATSAHVTFLAFDFSLVSFFNFKVNIVFR